MHIASYYLRTLQTQLDLIGNNIANVNTPGFKEQLRSFEEMYDRQDRSWNNALFGRPLSVNGGVAGPLYTGMRMNMSSGTLVSTGSTLDAAISGGGYFQVRLPGGELAYTRVGHFTIDQDRNLVTYDGLLLEPALRVPAGAQYVSIDVNGVITAEVNNTIETIGQISLAFFVNEQGMQQIGGGLFLETAESGAAMVNLPGVAGIGSLATGMLEMSNVDLGNNMVDMISVQRAYQIKSRSIRTQDEMLQTAIGMRAGQ
ncbi:MAG: flagellar hook-basal body complex protein [Gracilibacteraceae bacterium]|jgi:flagellar basal-body rod protein FlgG|nr:flagellar hook-basal body complex protein [Gracilibacteraceae bacterium]